MKACIVIYDISCDKIRLRVANRLLKDGERVQESAFEVFFKTDAARLRLERDLAKLMHQQNGNVRWYGLNQDALALSGAIGSAVPAFPPSLIVL